MSHFFENVPEEPPNSILGVNQACKVDPFPEKINLTIGAYRSEDGKAYVLPSVRAAEDHILNAHVDHEYLVQDGLAEFNKVAQIFLFGANSSPFVENRIYTIQTVAGTGAVRVGVDLIHRLYPGRPLLIPDVTWPNHNTIAQAVGVAIQTYRYLDDAGVGFNFQGMLDDLEAAEENSILLLHACAHNPTGVDPSIEEWKKIVEVVKRRHLLPFFDSAYQGFVSGDPTLDAFAVRLFVESGLELLVAASFSKNFGLYGERLGALHVVVPRAEEVPRVASICRALARPLYSTCPTHGARIVAHILSDPKLSQEWLNECNGMAQRLLSVRSLLYEKLKEKNVRGNWEHIVKQKGMFSFSGIRGENVERLKKDHHIYFLSDGRISLSGLNQHNIDRFVDALKDVLGTN